MKAILFTGYLYVPDKYSVTPGNPWNPTQDKGVTYNYSIQEEDFS